MYFCDHYLPAQITFKSAEKGVKIYFAKVLTIKSTEVSKVVRWNVHRPVH